MSKKEELLEFIEESKTQFYPYAGIFIKSPEREQLELYIIPYLNFENLLTSLTENIKTNIINADYKGNIIVGWAGPTIEEIISSFEEYQLEWEENKIE